MTLTEAVLEIFDGGNAYTPAEVHALTTKMGRGWLLTSVRREITVLTDAGILRNTGEQKMGAFGKLNYIWKKA